MTPVSASPPAGSPGAHNLTGNLAAPTGHGGSAMLASWWYGPSHSTSAGCWSVSRPRITGWADGGGVHLRDVGLVLRRAGRRAHQLRRQPAARIRDSDLEQLRGRGAAGGAGAVLVRGAVRRH